MHSGFQISYMYNTLHLKDILSRALPHSSEFQNAYLMEVMYIFYKLPLLNDSNMQPCLRGILHANCSLRPTLTLLFQKQWIMQWDYSSLWKHVLKEKCWRKRVEWKTGKFRCRKSKQINDWHNLRKDTTQILYVGERILENESLEDWFKKARNFSLRHDNCHKIFEGLSHRNEEEQEY